MLLILAVLVVIGSPLDRPYSEGCAKNVLKFGESKGTVYECFYVGVALRCQPIPKQVYLDPFEQLFRSALLPRTSRILSLALRDGRKGKFGYCKGKNTRR